ncbi:MAG: hypothetical protein H6702_03400 [Myxococcales bacterium]|nr:hypothetical protein [Myxococcales bacterium]
MAIKHTLGRMVLAGALVGGLAACDDEETVAPGGLVDDGSVACQDGLIAQAGRCALTGTYTRNLTLTADKEYLLIGGVFIDGGATLKIDAGVTLKGDLDQLSFLAIARGAKIDAVGTAAAPIVFTSSQPEGQRARGDWGGLIINGAAPINGCDAPPCTADGEGDTGNYGGSDPNDNSGKLKYVRVEFAGRLISEGNELNGIAFQGVGAGTEVDYVQVHFNKDDGVEFFGGTVNAKHLLLTGIGDDSLDWTDGWIGKAQYVLAVQYPGDGDQGIEADNNGDNNSAAPRSKPTLSHVTLVGSGGDDSDIGMLIREGTGAELANVIVTNFGEACFSLDQAETALNAWDADAMALSGELTLHHSIAWCPSSASFLDGDDLGGSAPFTTEAFFSTLNEGNQIIDPALMDLAGRDYRPAMGSPAAGGAVTPADPFFEQAAFIGALGDTDWTAGWATWAEN